MTDIDEADFDVSQGGQVEIIGWIYQYYSTEPKNAAFKKNKYSESDIPAVTQLFTPDWIVKYLVENSLGRYWINVIHSKGNEKSSKEIAAEYNWNYFMPTAKQDDEVQVKISNQQKELTDTTIEDITLIDPAMGSGHILVYAFEVFMQIYMSEGYSKRDAAKLILKNNLFGLDIDTRAFQLAYFSIMMKARNYNRRILALDIVPNIYDIPEYQELDFQKFEEIIPDTESSAVKSIIESFKYGKDYGSLISASGGTNWDKLLNLENTINSGQMSFETINFASDLKKLKDIITVTKLLSSKYTVSVTNPPYMGSGKMDTQLSKYVRKHFPDSKSDLFAVFMERAKGLTQDCGYYALITQHSWMFLSSFENLRKKLTHDTLINMAHLGTRAFEDIGGEVVQSTAFVIQNTQINDFVGGYERLVDFDSQDKKEMAYLKAVKDTNTDYFYRTNQANFSKIPGSPIAYWVSKKIFEMFKKYPSLGTYAEPRQGMATSDNKRFLKEWYEVDQKKIMFNAVNADEARQSLKKWFPYNKGGSYRKWYGNNSLVVNWENSGEKVMQLATKLYKSPTRTIKNIPYYFRNGLTWSALSSGDISFRYSDYGCLFDSKGPMVFIDNSSNEVNYYYLMAFLNSNVVMTLLKILAPTLDFNQGPMRRLPLIVNDNNELQNKVDSNIFYARTDWDSFETSWDFQKHPLLNHIADDKQLFNAKLLESSYVCAKIVTTVPFGGYK
ncbi:hypothetical protein CPBBRM18_IMEEAPEM_01992 [Companilactobacillus paralimentarius]